MSGAKETIAAIENRERERTGIKKLKIGYNRVFGYYIEIPRSSGQEIPGDYVRKQTLTSGERYINDELKQMESAILTAEDRLKALEYELFTKLREYVASQVARVQSTAAAIAELDVYCAFAQTAADEGYTRPEVDYSGVIEIKDGRHPVVEKVLSGSLFVPNDTSMNNTSELVQIITGPNMAGKSTYMRQVALIVLMAQIGSYVPASRARIGVVDRIFTRIGASDDLAGGQSTFMVEMSEVAEMLSNATSRSLLILDEIGRGTSTFDGMAIARAVVEYVASGKLGARTLFATHYHELTELEDKLERVKNYNIAAKKRGDDIIFLRKIVRGGADDSYGIEVAKLAGLPDCVVERSKEILASLESGKEVRSSGRKSSRSRVDPGQITLVDQGAAKIAQRLGSLDINTLTPLEALNILYEMKREL
jgi:DNA mismatch repair protein MutS